MESNKNAAPCDSPSCSCGNPVSRRHLLKLGGLTAAAALAHPLAVAGPFTPADTSDHFIPADKKLTPQWIKLLLDRGAPQWYERDDLRMIGMPVGGIAAGQLYIGGDGKLLYWDIYNKTDFTGYGSKNYFAGPPTTEIEQGFTVTATAPDGKESERALDRQGFPGVRFCGEYPLARIEYADAGFPLRVALEAFSPFIPLNEEDSAIPVTVMHFTATNTTGAPMEASLSGILQNAVARFSEKTHGGARVNRVVRQPGWVMVRSAAHAPATPPSVRPPIVLQDFEGKDYGKWTVEGNAFGDGPAHGRHIGQREVTGYVGSGLVNSCAGGSDKPQGKLTSPPFKIERNFICFLIGGGDSAAGTCINLLLDGNVVRTMTGKKEEKLTWQRWDVRELAGRDVRIEIVDHESGPWGHVNVDQIELRDDPDLPSPLEREIDFGSMGLAVLGGDGVTAWAEWRPEAAAAGGDAPGEAEAPFGTKLVGRLAQKLQLAAGESRTATFLVAWHFPNREHGHRYAQRFKDAADVVGYVAEHFQRLADQTRLWHRTWYDDSTLPRWLLNRLFSSVSTLATGTCLWYGNGRFWGWEGVGCCEGTCAHVWNYEHAMARLFPGLERSVRTMQDLDPGAGFEERSGAVRFRGEAAWSWAADSQGGTAMKCLREHQISADGAFLKQYWPRIRKTIQFLIEQDGDGDGLIEGKQGNTYDVSFYGPNTMVGSLYLGALRAGEQMALEIGDTDFAATCRRLFEAGSANTLKRLWNGEYFIQQVDLAQHAKDQYADGCLTDQLIGQGWAHQVGLGYLYPAQVVRSALKAIWTYNWAPDVGPQNAKHPPERWFARPGEGGLFICTWPRGKHMGKTSVRYRDEIWTGVEYQAAGHMAWEGMVTEALAVCRAIHERYHPAWHNPWNEIECGDHYARGMASYGVFLGLCGFEYHGPQGHIGFAPRLTQENFSAAFTASEGWGSFAQKIDGGALSAELAVHWGRLRLRSLSLGTREGFRPTLVEVTAGTARVDAKLEVSDGKAMIRLASDSVLKAGEKITAVLRA